MIGDIHGILDMIHQAKHCHDCGKRLNLVKEIRRCKKCKEIYKKEKREKKKKKK